MKGSIQNISYLSGDGWGVFTFKPEADQSKPESLPGLSAVEIVKCTGTIPSMVTAGDTVTLEGSFVDDKKHGKQFKCSAIIPEPPDVDSAQGVEKLLQKMPGIGAVKAQAAVKKYGHKLAWQHALDAPDKLGISSYNIEQAKELAASLSVDFNTLTYLLGVGCTDFESKKIMDKYKKNSILTVSEDPYRMIYEINGFGWARVDTIALKAGLTYDNDARIMACIFFVLHDSECNGGNIWLPGWELVKVVLDQLKKGVVRAGVRLQNGTGEGISEQRVRKLVYRMGEYDYEDDEKGGVVIENGKVYGKKLLKAEQTILNSL